MDRKLLSQWAERSQAQLTKHSLSLNGPCSRLNEAMQYVLNTSGKYLRASLVYLMGQHYQVPLSRLDPIATAIECVHAFSLVHDDLPAMDDDDWRRHQPSCHKAFDEATAILCGDALLSEAFSVICTCPTNPQAIVNMIQQLSLAVGTRGLCGGQSLDMTLNADNTQASQLPIIQAHKTGALFSVACELPYLASGNNCSTQRHHLRELGIALGHCLQISDDILDQTATHEELGKTPNKDAEQNKASYTTLYNLDECIAHCKRCQQEAMQHADALNINDPELTKLMTYLFERALSAS